MSRRLRRPFAVLPILALLAGACGGAGGAVPSAGASPAPTSDASAGPSSPPAVGASPALTGVLTIYSGRNEQLVGPLIERFRSTTGLDVRVNYGDTAELAATILEEGDNSPADVFFAQDAGALGALAAEGRLAELPAATLERVDPRFRSPDGVWVGASGRARVAVYDSRVLGPADLPDSILDFTDPAWRGKLGWAPTNGSFQAFVTALRVLRGEETARAWLEGILANEPRVYEGNMPIVEAVAAGEIEVGFVNHYYLMRQLAERGDAYPVRNHFFAGGDPGALVNVAGVGVLRTARNPAAALAFVDFLLSEESQRYFSEATFEYPLVDGIAADPRLVPLDEIESPEIDLSDLADLQGTLELLRDVGAL